MKTEEVKSRNRSFMYIKKKLSDELEVLYCIQYVIQKYEIKNLDYAASEANKIYMYVRKG